VSFWHQNPVACWVVQHINICAQICVNNSPDKYDSTGNGTVILRFRVAFRFGKVPVMLVQSNSQGPFRFSQALRCICGLGYSGWGKDLSTSFVQGVIIVLPLASCHAQQTISWKACILLLLLLFYAQQVITMREEGL